MSDKREPSPVQMCIGLAILIEAIYVLSIQGLPAAPVVPSLTMERINH